MIAIEFSCVCGKLYRFECLDQRYLCRCGWCGTARDARKATRTQRTQKARAATAKQKIAIKLLWGVAQPGEGLGDVIDRVALAAASHGKKRVAKYLEEMLAECSCGRANAIAGWNTTGGQ